MSNFVIEIKAPELANALQALAAAIAGKQMDKLSCPAPKPKAAAPMPAPTPAAVAASPQPAVPVSVAPPAPTVPPQATAPIAAPVAPPAAPVPAAPPQPVVPTSVPQYTYEMLFNAAAALMGQNKGPQLQQLLVKYGIQRLPDLPPEQYGAYATDLRALGAKL